MPVLTTRHLTVGQQKTGRLLQGYAVRGSTEIRGRGYPGSSPVRFRTSYLSGSAHANISTPQGCLPIAVHAPLSKLSLHL